MFDRECALEVGVFQYVTFPTFFEGICQSGRSTVTLLTAAQFDYGQNIISLEESEPFSCKPLTLI